MTQPTDQQTTRDTWWGVVLVVVVPAILLVMGAWVLPDIHAAETAAVLPLPESADSAERTEQANADRDARAELRAFYTAPPVIPHEVLNQMTSKECQHCHAEVREIGGRTTMVTPHPTYSNCLQCHAATQPLPLDDEETELPPTEWEGLEAPPINQQAHTLAPPMVPHRTFLREDCLTCHDLKSPYESLRCKHPERRNCTGCHVTDAKYNF